MSFLVCDARRGTVLFQDSLSQSQVFWSDSTHIRVTPSPEAINGDETPPGGYVFDVRQGKKQ